MLAACGFETSAPGPGPHSFTNALIKELRDMSTLDFPFAVAMLHQRIVARLVDYSPQYSSVKPFVSVLGSGQPRATPVYISLGRDFRQKSMPLESFHSTHTSGSRSTASNGSTEQSKAGDTVDFQSNRTASAIKRLLGDDNAPKVLLAITLHGNHWQNLERAFADWMKDMPVLAASINIEAVFHGLSTMILLSMPIAVWDLFPEHPSCSFVGFVQSSNLLPSPMSLLSSKQEDSAYANNTIWKFDLWPHIFRIHLVLKRISNTRLVWEPSNIFGTCIRLLSALEALLYIPFILYYAEPFVHNCSSYFAGEPSPYADAADPAWVTIVRSDTDEVSRSSLLIIVLWVLICFRLDDTGLLRIADFSSSFQKHWKRDLWSFIRTLAFMPSHTFAIWMISVIDLVLSGKGLEKFAHVDGVRWTLAHTRYAAMGGFVVQRPVTATIEAFGGHQRPISLSPRALLQARQTGSLAKLPDIDITQRWRTSNTWTGRLLVLRVAWYLIQSFIRRRECLSITPLEIIACVFGTYTVMIYIFLDNAIFSKSVPTILSLRELKGGDNLRFSHDPRTRSGRASYVQNSNHRRQQNHIDPVHLLLGLVAGCLIFETLPRPIKTSSLTVHALLARVLFALITLVIFQRRPYEIRLSNRAIGALAKVGLGIVIFLTLMAASPNLASLMYIGVFLSAFVAENFNEDRGDGEG